MLHPQKHAAQQNRLRTIPVLDARMLDTAGRAGQAGVVVNHVQLAEFFYGALDSRLDVGLGSDVGPLKDGAATVFTAFAHRRFGAFNIEVCDDHCRAFTGETNGSDATHSAGGPSDNRYFAVESAHFSHHAGLDFPPKRENVTLPNDGIIQFECPKSLA